MDQAQNHYSLRRRPLREKSLREKLGEKPDNFKFRGFLPSKPLQQKGKAIYSLMEDRSPSEAAKKASLTKVGGVYEARLKVVSASCSFEIFSAQAAPSESMDDLYKKFTTKILKWTKERESLSFTHSKEAEA